MAKQSTSSTTYALPALTATRLAGYTNFRVTTAPARATKGKLVFLLAMGRTLTVTKVGKRWHWQEASPAGVHKGAVLDGLANLSRMLPA